MARPETIEDVPSYMRTPFEVFSWEPAYLTGHPEIEQHIVAARIAAKQAGFAEAEPGHNKVVRHRTDEELEEQLVAAQRAWDNAKVAYETALERGMAPQYPYVAATYSTAEGLPSLADLLEEEKLKPFEKAES